MSSGISKEPDWDRMDKRLTFITRRIDTVVEDLQKMAVMGREMKKQLREYRRGNEDTSSRETSGSVFLGEES